MIEVKKFFLVSVLLIGLTGCTQAPVITVPLSSPPAIFTPAVEKTATPPPLPVLTLTPMEIMSPDLSSSTPTFTPVPAGEMPSGFSPILYGKKYDGNTFFFLLGGWQGQWLSADAAFPYFANLPGWDYDVYPLTLGKFQVHGDRPVFSPTSKIYTVGTQITVNEPGMVGVAKGWPVLQRDVQELSPDNEMYRQIVLDWLTAQGIAAPELSSLHVFRVDIEGDGVDEVFISATRLENQHMTKPGDYSIVLMRRVQGNDAVTLPIVADIYHSQETETTLPRVYSLGNFLDLNQDRVLEVVIDFQRWELDGALIYQINGQNITQVP